MSIVAHTLISVACLLRLSISLCICIHYIARQRLVNGDSATTNAQATMEEMLYVSLYMGPLSYERKVGDQLLSDLFVY
jgi:hypothetical protein